MWLVAKSLCYINEVVKFLSGILSCMMTSDKCRELRFVTRMSTFITINDEDVL